MQSLDISDPPHPECSSTVKDTSFSWEPEALFDGSFWRGSPNANISVVWSSYSPNRNVTFICIASNGLTNASRVVRETCQDEQPKPDVVVEGETRIPGIVIGALHRVLLEEGTTCATIVEELDISSVIVGICRNLTINPQGGEEAEVHHNGEVEEGEDPHNNHNPTCLNSRGPKA
ncbi:unnamed protein product [Coregonus sp. 'balchen']|nr:unnamed protein product [Coregonus sp. 'balchen']